jgi:solute:Na+ symporter, SSS family
VVTLSLTHSTPAPDYASIQSLTFGTSTLEDKKKTRASWSSTDIMTSGVVLLFILGAYLYFRG